MADINLSIKVVSADGSTRTVELSRGGSFTVKAGDRLILFGPDADKATLVRSGDNLALMIDNQQYFVLDGYYALAGDQAAEVITDPAVAATFLTAAEGGLPLLTTPPTETAGPAPAETDTPQVDLVQATSPTLPGDNASATAWRSDEEILLDDPTYRPIVIEYLVEDELIITEAPPIPPGPTPPAPEPVNLPPYFTTVIVTVDDGGDIVTATPDPDDPVDEYNFQMYEFVKAYQPLPNIYTGPPDFNWYPPHYENEEGDYPAGHPYWVGMFFDSCGAFVDTATAFNGENGPRPQLPFEIAFGWGYLPNAFLGWVGVVDPEGDPITVWWDNGSDEGVVGPPGWNYMLSEPLNNEAFLESYGFPWGPEWGPNGQGVLELYQDTFADGSLKWDENAYAVYASMLVGGVYDYSSWYDYDQLAEIYGPTDHFTTTLFASDGINPDVSVPVNFEILDVNEAPLFEQWIYHLDPWNGEGFDNPFHVPYIPQEPPDGPPNGVLLTTLEATEEVIVPEFVPDYELPEGFGIYVGNVLAIDPDFLDKAEYGGQVLYSFMHDIDEGAQAPWGDPDWVPYIKWVGDDPDTAGWRAELLDQFSEDGNLWINETTGDIWAANDAWTLVPHSLTWDYVPSGWDDSGAPNVTWGGPHGWWFNDDDSYVYATAWKEGEDDPKLASASFPSPYPGWSPGPDYDPADLAYTEYNGKSGLLVEGKGPESAVDETDADEWLVLNFERPVLLIDMDLQLFYDSTGKCKPFEDFEWGKYAITSADGNNTFEVYIEANSSDGDFNYIFEHTGYVSSIAFQAGDWMTQTGDWANDFLLHAISYEQLPSLDPALVYAHDVRDRNDDIFDEGGNLIYDADRIYSDLWDAAVVLVTDPPSPEDHPILNDQRHWTQESMQTAAPIQEWVFPNPQQFKTDLNGDGGPHPPHPIPEYNIYDGILAEPVFWLGDLIDLDGDAVTYAIIGGDPDMQWQIVYGDGHYENGIWVDDGGVDTKAYIVANDATTLDYEDVPYFNLTVETYENSVAYDTGQIEIWLTNVNESPWIDHFHGYNTPTQNVYDNPVEPWNFATLEGGEPQPLFEHRDAMVNIREEDGHGLFGYLGDFDSFDEDFLPPPPPEHLHYSLTGSEDFDPSMGFTAENHPADHVFYLNYHQANKYFDIGKHSGHLSLKWDWKDCEWEIDELIRGTYEFRVLVNDAGIDGPKYWDSAIVSFEVANHLPDVPCIDPMYESMQTPTNYLLDDETFVTSGSIMSDGLVLIGQTTDFDGDILAYSTSTAGWAIATIGTNVYLSKLNPDQINYEVQNVYYDVAVEVTDGIDTANWELDVHVLNVNETPVLSDAPDDATLDVTASIGSVLADFDATDVDNPEVLTYKLLALDGSSFDPNAYFSIDSDGVITTIADLSALYVDGAPNEFSFRVVVEDDGGPKADGTPDISGETAGVTIEAIGVNSDSFLADEEVITFTLTDNLHGIQYNGRANYLCDQRLTTEVSVQNGNGEGRDVRAGFSVSNLGDINGDGFDDFIIGAPYASTEGTEYEPSEEVSGFSSLGNQTADSFFIADYMSNSFGGDIGLTIDAHYSPGGSETDTDVTAGWHYESGSAHGLGVFPTNRFYVDYNKDETLTFEFTEDVEIRGVELIDLFNNNETARMDFYDDGVLTHYLTVNIGGGGTPKTATVTLTDVSTTISTQYVESVEAGPHLYDLSFAVTTDYIEFTSTTSGDKYAVGGLIGGYDGTEATWQNGEAYVIFGDGTWDPHDITTLPFDLTRAVHLDSEPDLGGSGAVEPAEAGFVIHGETGWLAAGGMAGFSVANAGDVNGDGLADIFVGAPYVDREDTTPRVWVDGEYFSFGAADDAQKLYSTSNKDYRVDNYLPDGSGGWIGVTVDGDEKKYHGGWRDKYVTWNTDDDSFGIKSFDGDDDEVDGQWLDERLTFIFDSPATISGFKLEDVDSDDSGWAVLHLAAGGTQTVAIPDGQSDFHFAEVSVNSVEFFPDTEDHNSYAVAGFYGAGHWEGGTTTTTYDVGAAYVIFGSTDPWGPDFYLDDLDGTNGFKIIGDDVTENAGWSVHAAMDFDGDGIDDLIIGAPHTDGATAPNYGEVYVVWGDTDWTANGGVLDLDNLNGDGFRIHNKGGNNDYDESGFSVGSMGDINGDGASEIVFGVPSDDVSGADTGSVYVLHSDAGDGMANNYYHQNDSAGLWHLWNAQGLAIRLDGENVGDNAGWSVSSAGDIDGDGIDDLIIGAPNHDYTYQPEDVWVPIQKYMPFGAAASRTAQGDDYRVTNFMDTNVTIYGWDYDGYNGWQENDGESTVTWDGDSFGIDGDWDGSNDNEIDGDEAMQFVFDDDLVLNGIRFDHVGYNEGVTIELWNDGSQIDTLNYNGSYYTDVMFGSEYTVDEVWVYVDNFDDVAIAGFHSAGYWEEQAPVIVEDSGAAYVVFGSYLDDFVDVDNATIDLGSLDGTNGFKIVGDDEGDRLGISVSGAGDVNGDGVDDVIVGAFGDDNNTGEAVIIFGADLDGGDTATWQDGIISTEDILTDEFTSGVVLEGISEGDMAGASVSGAGDVNGDGFDDVVVGAPEAEGDTEGGNGGEAYLIFGGGEMTNADALPIEELVEAA